MSGPKMDRERFFRDFLASLVVFLVALPLCMGIAIASGVPPAMGLLAGIVGGLVVGFLAGSPLQVSGPAAGLAVIVYEIVQQRGIDTLLVVVFAAGIIQLGAGYLKMGRWFQAVPHSVVYGMLGGIGVLIFGSQFHVMVDDSPKSSGLENLFTIPQAILKAVQPTGDVPHHLAAGIGVLTLVILVVWNAVRGRMPKGLSLVPAPLLAVTAASAAAAGMGLPIRYVEVPDTIEGLIRPLDPSMLLKLGDPAILGLAIAMAVVASAETMLCATAVDRLHDGVRTDYDRELKAQGVGNMLLGLLGGLPLTGVIVRSSANIEAGATTRLSAILHGLWLLMALLLFPGMLRVIPVASLAAVLVYIGYRLVNVKVIKALYQHSRTELAIYLVTLSAIVATNLLEGLLIGLGLAVARLAWTASKLDVEMRVCEDGKRVDLMLFGSATFASLPKLVEALEKLPPDAEAHIHLEHLRYIDHACLETIREWERQREAKGGKLVLEWDELHRRVVPMVRPSERPPAIEGACEEPETASAGEEESSQPKPRPRAPEEVPVDPDGGASQRSVAG